VDHGFLQMLAGGVHHSRLRLLKRPAMFTLLSPL
jgi:hypothetical protein